MGLMLGITVENLVSHYFKKEYTSNNSFIVLEGGVIDKVLSNEEVHISSKPFT